MAATLCGISHTATWTRPAPAASPVARRSKGVRQLHGHQCRVGLRSWNGQQGRTHNPSFQNTVAQTSRRNWTISATATQSPPVAPPANEDIPTDIDTTDTILPPEVDVVVIGAGFGGLCCAGLLAWAGYKVAVVESHYRAGGVAHSFPYKGYLFDAGPSFHAGLSMQKSLNPLKQVLDILGEKVEYILYDSWIAHVPEGVFTFVADRDRYLSELIKYAGEDAREEYLALEKAIEPLALAAAALPAAAMRSDLGFALSVWRFLPDMIKVLPAYAELLEPFSRTVDKVVRNPFLRKLIDLECFVLSALLADSTITAEMAFMFYERHREGRTIDYPIGGGGAIVDGLVRGLRKHKGQLFLQKHVDEILVENGQAVGVKLRPKRSGEEGAVIRAKKAVVSNASVWDTMKLLPAGTIPEETRASAVKTPMTNSCMHLHLGIDKAGLPDDLQIHYMVVHEWDVLKPSAVVIVSIPTVLDPSLAPPGKHLVHAYTITEPYSLWEGLDKDKKSPEYEALKTERVQPIWEALEKIIPDIRDRSELVLMGSPLTHEFFNRRSRGTYGPAIVAGKQAWPGPDGPLPGLYYCGDSTMPGIGVPAVAGSGMMCANRLIDVWQHLKMLDRLDAVAAGNA